jgi:hypothetical protein
LQIHRENFLKLMVVTLENKMMLFGGRFEIVEDEWVNPTLIELKMKKNTNKKLIPKLFEIFFKKTGTK